MQFTIHEILKDDIDKKFRLRAQQMVELSKITIEEAEEQLKEEKEKHLYFAEKFEELIVIYDPLERNINNNEDEP